ncbi:MAG: amino acid adenylation domain-containing protein, partial [Succinivibrionaceae bacterium]|nr:amino acid adenylation domain-containing protein [Succinivibrionaceae bacterium]
YMISQTPQVILDHQVYEFNGELYDAWDMADAVFPEGLADDLFNSYRHLLESLAENPQTIYEQINLPLNPETVKERTRCNSTGWEIPAQMYGDGTIHGRILRHAAEHPEDPALFFADQQISYGRLRESALRVASLLLLNGLSAGDRVMISVPRGPLEIVSVLGVLAAGGVYVPVSATQPDARRNRIIHTGQIRFMLSTAPFVPDDSSVRVLNPMDASSLDCLETPAVSSPDDPAYIIFTSGSTGEPKGVEISHRGALNTILDITDRCSLGRSSTALAVSALDFDLSVFDIFGILGAGGRLVLISSDERRDASCWLSLVHRYGINTWNSVPVLLEMLLAVHRNDNKPLPLTTVMLSGDWINTEIPQDLADACGGTLPHLLAMGGATEGSIWSNLFEVSLPLPDGWKSIPYGYPLRNQKYRIADAKGRDCPDLVPGELWIGGTGVALGYVNAPEITAAHFVEFEGERWYRTGDQGRYHKGGIMEFLGRLDHQVKVRGHRIELGEIESALCSVGGVKRALALTAENAGRIRLAAAVETDDSSLSQDFIRQQLFKCVPEYMVPENIIFYASFPVSANGKIDRKTVIREIREQISCCACAGEAPATDNEKAVASIWSRLLHLDSISRSDSFFEIGGDSLLATEFTTCLAQHGLYTDEPLRKLFAKPVLKDFAAELTAGRAETVITLEHDEQHSHDPFPLTEVQRAYWMGQAPGLSLKSRTWYLVELTGSGIDLKRLNRAFAGLFEEHDMLKARLTVDGR